MPKLEIAHCCPHPRLCASSIISAVVRPSLDCCSSNSLSANVTSVFEVPSHPKSKLRASVANLARILAVELVCAGHGIDLRAPLQPGAGTAAALGALRASVAGPGPDRQPAPDLAAAEELITSGELLGAVEAQIGALA